MTLPPGLHVALVTPLGRFTSVDRVPAAAQPHDAGALTAHRDGVVVLGRADGGGGRELARALAAVPAPATVAGAAAYAAELARAIAAAGADVTASLAVVTATERGLAGWVCGAVAVVRVDGGVAPCAPSQLLDVPPGAGLPQGLVRSGITGDGVLGGDAFEAHGRRFAIVLATPADPPTAGELGDADGLVSAHLLERVGRAVAAGRHGASGLAAVWEVPPGPEPSLAAWTASADRLALGDVPTSWPELAGPLRGSAGVAVERLLGVADELDDPPKRRDVAFAVAMRGEDAAVAAALAGPHVTRELLAAHARYAEAVADWYGAPSLHEAEAAAGALRHALAARACGLDVTPRPDPIAWLEELAADPDRAEADPGLALLALAEGAPALVERFVLDAPPARAAPGLTFGFDAPRFARYLAAAARDGASFEDVAPAWRDHLRAFPHKHAAGTLRFADLLAAAVVVRHRIGGAPLADVGGWLHGELAGLARG